jgi:hypothetical protein
MENLTPRHIKDVESARMGIKAGWYGIKINGTLVTDRSASLEECLKQIEKVTGRVISPL